MKIPILAALLFLMVSECAYAQPTLFAPELISNDGVFGFTLSSDGNTALWVLSKGKRDTLIIKESHLVDGMWTQPVTASFSNNGKWKDIDPVFTPDERVLFQSTRPAPGNSDRKGFDIWAVDRKGNQWSEPYHLGNDINTDASESFASATKKGAVYFMKENPNGKGKSDIYVSSFMKGKYKTPVALGLPVNTSNRESNPFISSKGDYIIYFSDDSTGYGDVDLFISFNKNGHWTAPVNLGNSINGVDAEFCPFYHEKQKRLYFARQRKGGERLIENIFSIDFDPYSYRR